MNGSSKNLTSVSVYASVKYWLCVGVMLALTAAIWAVGI